jgi:bla regulator protein BlaR1
MRVLKSAVMALVIAAVSVSGFAGGMACKAGHARVFADDHTIFANGISDVDMDSLTARYGKTFLYVERGAKAYLVTDADTLDRVRHILLPQSQLGQQQAALGTKQAALGSQQAALGMKQARLGMQQIGASEAKQRELERRQSELGRQQEELGRQQEALGREQEKLGAQQETLQVESDKKVDAILDQAITSGTAKTVK